MYMCVCIYIYIYIYMHMYVCTHVHMAATCIGGDQRAFGKGPSAPGGARIVLGRGTRPICCTVPSPKSPFGPLQGAAGEEIRPRPRGGCYYYYYHY